MPTFNKEELLHIANLSALKLEDKEVDFFADQIKKILTYIDQLQQVTITQAAQPVSNVNIFRDDQAQSSNAAEVLAQAPSIDEHYIVVPKILEEK